MYLLFLILFFKTFAGMLFINKYLYFSPTTSPKNPGFCHRVSRVMSRVTSHTPRVRRHATDLFGSKLFGGLFQTQLGDVHHESV